MLHIKLGAYSESETEFKRKRYILVKTKCKYSISVHWC